MPPSGLLMRLSARAVDRRRTTDSVSQYLDVQWQNLSDILSVLLLLGPEIIQRAVAQLAGRAITPVAFSFGWVAYAVNVLSSSVGGSISLFNFQIRLL